MASIKDVALAAGVSVATVSRVLSRKTPVSEQLREKVETAVNALGYRPNLVARNLRSQKSNTIGLIVSDIRNPFFTAISRAVEDIAYAQGYNVVLCNSDENPTKEGLYLQLMQDEYVAGVIFSPTMQCAQSFSALSMPFPTVIIDRRTKIGDCDTVLLENRLAAYQLTQHLIENGFQRISGIFGRTSFTGRERYEGYLQALKEASLDPKAYFVEPRMVAAETATSEMLASKQKPDAIVCSNSLLTAGAFRSIHTSGLKIPRDIALAGFDEALWTEMVSPSVTTFEQPTSEIGKLATELLFQRIKQPERAVREVSLRGQMIVRGSTQRQPVNN